MEHNHLEINSLFAADHRFNEWEWNQQEAVHLLKRSFFGITKKQFYNFRKKNQHEIIYDLLHTRNHNNTFPLKDYLVTQADIPDSNIDFGKPWINDDNYDHTINKKRRESLRNWVISKLYSDEDGLRPKMILFWNNFFSIELSKITFATKSYNYFEIINRNALDNFKDLLIEVILDQTVLQYVNKIKSPGGKISEVFASLILNEYTLGEKYFDLIGKGRYRKLVRLLNQWSLISDSFALYSKKRRKILSDKQNYDSYLNTPGVKNFVTKLNLYFDYIFKFPEVSRNLTRKIFTWFLQTSPDEEAEKRVIIPVSEAFASNKYDITSLLNAFFLNPHFSNKIYLGCATKSPVDFVFGICKEFNIYPFALENTIKDYYYWNFLRFQIELLGQKIGDFQSAGDSPDSEYFQLRNAFVEKIFDSGFQCGKNILKADPVEFAAALNAPWDPHSLIDESVVYLCGKDLSQKLKGIMKRHFLLDGKEDDSIWTLKWFSGTNAPGNELDYKHIFNRLCRFYKFLLKRTEYQQK